MNKDMYGEFKKTQKELHAAIASEISHEIFSNVNRMYKIIDLKKVPNHVNYSKVEKYLRSINVEITRKMFITYIKDGLLPSDHDVKNNNYSFYTKNQIIYYVLVDMFKPILPLNKVKILLNEVLKPMIEDIGLERTYMALYEMIGYMVIRFKEAVEVAIKEEKLGINPLDLNIAKETDDEKARAKYHIEQYANLVTLCMARGALDFYKYSPNTLLEQD